MTSGHPPHSDPPRGGPPDDRAGHPDLDALADLDAGLPDPISAASLTEHVATCPACAEVLRALAAVRVELRALPPPPLPAGVAARLEATVAELRAAEPVSALGAAAGTATPPGDSGGPVGRSEAGDDSGSVAVADLGSARERRRERSRRVTTLVAASVVALAAAVGVGTAVLHQTRTGRTPAESAALPAERGAAQGGGSPASGGHRSGTATRPNGKTDTQLGAPPVPGSRSANLPSYTRATLVDALPAIEASSSVRVASAEGTQGAAGAMADATRRARCNEALQGVSGQLTAVRHATFEGSDAYVLVFDRPGQARSVVVVADTCGLGAVPQATVLYRWPQ